MKTRRRIALAFLPLAVMVCAFLLWLGLRAVHRDSSMPASGNVNGSLTSPRETTSVLLPTTNALPSDDSRPEVQLFYKLAMAAHFYNFNPEIVYHKTNDRPRIIDLGTPTHGATVTAGIIDRAYSYADGSDTRRKPEAMKAWYQCTGRWTKREAIAETFNILQRLGETEVLARLHEGRQECEAEEFKMFTPGGQSVEVTPFYQVALFDKDKKEATLRIEYRLGTNGPVGVTDWHFWP